jgi:hypothetical protein
MRAATRSSSTAHRSSTARLYDPSNPDSVSLASPLTTSCGPTDNFGGTRFWIETVAEIVALTLVIAAGFVKWRKWRAFSRTLTTVAASTSV